MALLHSFYGWERFHCLFVPHLYSFICWCSFRLLSGLGYWNSATINIRVCTSSWIMAFSSSLPRSRIARSCGCSNFSILRKFHTVLYGCCTNLYSHQHCGRVPFSALPCQHLLFLSFLMMAIFTGVKCYLIVALSDHMLLWRFSDSGILMCDNCI